MTRLDLAIHPLYNPDIDTALTQFAECRSTLILIQTSENRTAAPITDEINRSIIDSHIT